MNAKLSLAAALSVLALGSAAVAADLPRRATAPAPYVAPVPVFTWTGLYAGVNAGYGWGTQKGAANAAFGKLDGAQVGGTVGYNYQMGQIVLGVEGDGVVASHRAGCLEHAHLYADGVCVGLHVQCRLLAEGVGHHLQHSHEAHDLLADLGAGVLGEEFLGGPRDDRVVA